MDKESPHGRAPDVGCGTGRHTLELADRNWEAVWIDNVQRAVEKARRPRPGDAKAAFTLGDVTRLGGATGRVVYTKATSSLKRRFSAVWDKRAASGVIVPVPGSSTARAPKR